MSRHRNHAVRERSLSDRGGEISGKEGVSQTVVAGVTREDQVDMPEGVNGISGIFFVRKASVSGSRNVR